MARLVHSLAEIFSTRIFTIPDYQRGYAWGEKQWKDLLQDLELLPRKRDHFTGTLILRPHGDGKILDEEGRAYEPFDVIDGQQRLTTVVLLLKAIHEEMQLLGGFSNLANGLREMYLSGKNINGEFFTRLSLNRDSQDFFAHDILGATPGIEGPTIRSHRQLKDGKAHFKTYLQVQREQLGPDFPEWLKTLYLKLTQQLTLIVYEVESDLDAGVIFETMNDRGRPLTELEKVKNYLLYVTSKLDLPAPTSLAEKINTTWAHIFEELMGVNLSDSGNEDQLLRAHWLAVYDYNSQNWQQSRTIKERFALQKYVGKHAELLNQLLSYLDTLKNAATAYCDMHNPSRPNGFNDITSTETRKQIIYWSVKLARLGARASFQPLLIAVRLRGAKDGASYLETVRLCELFDFRVYVWMKKQSRAGQTQLFRLGYNYYHNENLQALLNAIREALSGYCTNEQFQQRFKDETANWYDWGGIKYYLYEYEEHLALQAGVPVRMPWEMLLKSRKDDTIEHILPQAADHPYWKERFDAAQVARWKHDLGNLTLTFNNSPLGKKPFRSPEGGQSEKRSYYAESVLLIEHELSEESEWTPGRVQARRERLQAWSLERWKAVSVPTASQPVPKHLDVSLPIQPLSEHRQQLRQSFIERAYASGIGNEFVKLLEILERFPLYCYLNPKYAGVSFALPKHRTTWVFWLHVTGLYVHYHPERFSQITGLSKNEIERLLGEERQYPTPDQIPAYAAGLEQILAMIEEKTKAQ